MEQGSDSWIQFRKRHIGASDAPVIMNVCKFKLNDGRVKTPYLLWEEKLGLLDTRVDNPAVRFGKETEEKARRLYEAMKGGEMYVPAVHLHKEKKFMIASLDGINLAETNAVEIKCANKDDHNEALRGMIPKHYYPQVQHQLAVLNMEAMDYFSYHDEDGVLVRVKRDDEYLEKLYEEEEKFWECVCQCKEPELTDKDFIERGKDWAFIAKEILELKQQKKEIESKISILEKDLKERSENKNSRGGGYRYTSYLRKGNIDYPSIAELKKVDLELYRKQPTISWILKKES